MPPTQPPPDHVFNTEIAPLWGQMEAALHKHNMTGVAAFSVPLTDKAGVMMLYGVADKDGNMPTPFFDAHRAISKWRAPASTLDSANTDSDHPG